MRFLRVSILCAARTTPAPATWAVRALSTIAQWTIAVWTRALRSSGCARGKERHFVSYFVGELVFGLLAGSVALLADSLDMLGDALVYGVSLYVVARGPVWKARAAVAKAAAMGLFGAFVLGQILYKFADPQVPHSKR
jgi:hypothetical protein